jgi:hypothetical protein
LGQTFGIHRNNLDCRWLILRLEWLSHVVRTDCERKSKKVLERKPRGGRQENLSHVGVKMENKHSGRAEWASIVMRDEAKLTKL